MQTEAPVEIYRTILFPGFGNRDCPTEIVILAVAVRDDHVETVDRAALENRHEDFSLPVTILQRLSTSELM